MAVEGAVVLHGRVHGLSCAPFCLLPPNRLSLSPSHSSWIPFSAQDANALSSKGATYTSGPNDSSLTQVAGRPRRALALDALALRPGRRLELEPNNLRSQLERDNYRLVELGQRRLPLYVSACLLSHSLRGLTRLSFALLCASWLWSWLRRVSRLSRNPRPSCHPSLHATGRQFELLYQQCNPSFRMFNIDSSINYVCEVSPLIRACALSSPTSQD